MCVCMFICSRKASLCGETDGPMICIRSFKCFSFCLISIAHL